MNIVKLKTQVVEDVIIRITLDGSFQRAKIYRDSIDDKKKEVFRKSLSTELNTTLKYILSKNKYSDEQHYETIEAFSKTISKRYADILRDGKLRIGIAQKLINLYWKFSWILKPGVNLPVHCPFDSVVINELGKSVQNLKWTTFNKISEYKMLVKAANEKIKDFDSIAEWELDYYYQRVNYNLAT